MSGKHVAFARNFAWDDGNSTLCAKEQGAIAFDPPALNSSDADMDNVDNKNFLVGPFVRGKPFGT